MGKWRHEQRKGQLQIFVSKQRSENEGCTFSQVIMLSVRWKPALYKPQLHLGRWRYQRQKLCNEQWLGRVLFVCLMAPWTWTPLLDWVILVTPASHSRSPDGPMYSPPPSSRHLSPRPTTSLQPVQSCLGFWILKEQKFKCRDSQEIIQ